MRQLRQSSRRPLSLRLKKSPYCASYKAFPAAGQLEELTFCPGAAPFSLGCSVSTWSYRWERDRTEWFSPFPEGFSLVDVDLPYFFRPTVPNVLSPVPVAIRLLSFFFIRCRRRRPCTPEARGVGFSLPRGRLSGDGWRLFVKLEEPFCRVYFSRLV